MNTPLILQYLRQYAAGNLPQEQEAWLLAELERMSPDELETLFPEADWKEIRPLPVTAAATDRSYDQLMQRFQSPSLRLQSRTWLKAACLVGIMLTCTWLFPHLLQPRKVSAITWKEVLTAAGEQKRVELADGTVIYLNGNSRLSMPEMFDNNKRTVKLLQGEAFLEVSPDTRRPFTVTVDNMEIQVLGTSFNVHNYPQDTIISVGVSSGKVAVQRPAGDTTLLTPGLKALFSRNTGNKQVLIAGANTIAGWHSGELVFEDAPLEEILAELQHLYGYTFNVKQGKYLQQRFRATFRHRKPEDIIRQLSVIGGFRYQLQDTVITIY